MGLTIHYQLSAPHAAERDAIELTAALAGEARGLGKVSKLITMPHGETDPARELLAGAWCQHPDNPETGVLVPPLWATLFSVEMSGSESFVLGLARYPRLCDAGEGATEPFPTGLDIGCHFRRWCKTQYASLPSNGGLDHFVRIHTGIVAILDRARALGIAVAVEDEGHYWQTRDVALLKAEVAKMNGLVAAVAGSLRDARGHDAVQSALDREPSFEHLEAEGHKLLKPFGDQLRGLNREIDRSLEEGD